MNTTTTTSSSLLSTASAGVTIKKIIEPEDDIAISKLDVSTTPTTSRPRLSRTKSIQSHNITNGCSIRRSRFASFRSKSLDNDNNNIERNRHRRSLNKSKTLHYLSSNARMMRIAENGNRCCQNGGNISNNNNRRIHLFDMNVDQSPLWTTLTHARTLSDFSAES